MRKLKNCPCCEKKATLIHTATNKFYVLCRSCGCQTDIFLREEEPIDRWNKRPNATKWHSVKDRLPPTPKNPSDFKLYMVSCSDKKQTWINLVVFTEKGWGQYGEHIVAWAKLPKKYTGGAK